MSATCPVVRVKSWHPSQGEFVEINESDFDAEKHERYVSPLPAFAPVTPLPVVPVVVDPLAGLVGEWQTDKGTGDLRDIANAVTGRMPENREQAIAALVEVLAARGN